MMEVIPKPLKKWCKYYADVIPSKGVTRVMKAVFDSRNPRYKKKNFVRTIEKEVPIEVEIPLVDVVVTKQVFDSRAMQSDDRFFETSRTVKRYDPELIKKEAEKALIGYNTEPKEVI